MSGVEAQTLPPPAAPARALELSIDPTALPSDVSLSLMIREVRAIWWPYVDVSVITKPGGPCMACRYRLDVRVTDAVRLGSRGAAALGWIEFVNGQPQPVISVSVTQGRRLLANIDWSGQPYRRLPDEIRTHLLSVALGRAVAHEIGHFLLRSTTHSTSGLMRPRFRSHDVMERGIKHFRLTQAEADRLALLTANPSMAPAASGPAREAAEVDSAFVTAGTALVPRADDTSHFDCCELTMGRA